MTKAISIRRVWAFLRIGATLALASCVAYEPAPLPDSPALVAQAGLTSRIPLRPLSLAALDRLVLHDNPDLAAARARLGVADAQVIVAGVLPNPQIAASYPFYIAGPNGSDAFGLSIAQDLKSLILRPTKREVAVNAAAEIRANLLWQEWQTIGKARLLFVDLRAGERLSALIARNRRFLKDRLDLTNKAIEQGNAPLATLSPDLVAVSEVEKAADDLERLQLSRRHQLNALLGRAADAPLTLVAAGAVPLLDPRRVRVDLASLAERRPDLVALQYGYRSQDARLRQAILAQFPNLAIGLAGGRDTSAIYSLGPQATFDLPLFDRNEGNIAVETATRDALGREFQARVTAATSEITSLLSEQALLRRQLATLEPRLTEARVVAEKTETAFKAGNFDERAYVDIEVALLAREQEKITLEQALSDGQIALATLTGAGLPSTRLAPEPPPADPFGLLHAVSQ